MPPQRRLFVPGWSAPALLYRPGVPAGWDVLQPPGFRAGGGELAAYVDWLEEIVGESGPPVVLAGHSMGGALAVLVAARRPERVARLVLLSPSGLPLQKAIRASLWTAVTQAARGVYPWRGVVHSVGGVLRAPRRALRLARALHDLDLTHELARVRRAGTSVTVIGCRGDTLVTAAHCRRYAGLLGAEYREVDLPDGHVWMIRGRRELRRELERLRIDVDDGGETGAPHGGSGGREERARA
jgi:pimeloyl-ACP methyl ester carboxylesterase